MQRNTLSGSGETAAIKIQNNVKLHKKHESLFQ